MDIANYRKAVNLISTFGNYSLIVKNFYNELSNSPIDYEELVSGFNIDMEKMNPEKEEIELNKNKIDEVVTPHKIDEIASLYNNYHKLDHTKQTILNNHLKDPEKYRKALDLRDTYGRFSMILTKYFDDILADS